MDFKKKVAQCYQFLRFCDDLSLALCQNDFENHKESLQIDPVCGQQKICLTQLPNGEFELDPWLFDEEKKEFYAEYYATDTDFYSEDEELRNDLDLLQPMEKKFVFTKKGHSAMPFFPEN